MAPQTVGGLSAPAKLTSRPGRSPLLLLLLLTVLLLPLPNLSGASDPPRFIQIPKDQILMSRGVASFVCQATGDPRPQIEWIRKGRGTLAQEHFEVIEFDEGAGSVLRIQPVRAPRDEAIYECVARNTEGEASVTSKLTILSEDKPPQGFPIIDMGPQLKVVERSRTATMLCAASGDPEPVISWFKDFLPVDPSASGGRITLLKSGALQIENSEDMDQGKYECVASNSQGVRYSSPANLYVRVGRVAPRFSIPPTNHEIMPGGSVNLTCVAVGSPMPHVKWMLGAEELTPEDSMPIGRNVLELTNVQQSANYTCMAISSLGTISAEAEVIVISPISEPPRFIQIPSDQIVVSGGVFSFVCQATGGPRPLVEWRKRGKTIVSQQNHIEVIEFDKGAGSVLRIEPVRAPWDEATYKCVARNTEGEASVTSKLTILSDDELPQGFPIIDMGPQLKVVERSRRATMLCAASGNTEPIISWFKDYLPVDPSASGGRIKLLKSGALQIENSEEMDQGKYECVASNSQGVRFSAPANLYVRVRRVTPRFSTLPTNHEIMPGGSVNLTCVAVGSPMPFVKWMLGSEDLTPEDSTPIGRNVLELTNVQQSANYTCMAMSSLGTISAEAEVIVKCVEETCPN